MDGNSGSKLSGTENTYSGRLAYTTFYSPVGSRHHSTPGRQRAQEIPGGNDPAAEFRREALKIAIAGDEKLRLANQCELQKWFIERIAARRDLGQASGHADGGAEGQVVA